MGSDVIIGKDGWLFIKNGTNSHIDYYNEKDKFNSDLIESWHDVLNSRHDKLKKLKVKYIHLIVPNKLSVYPEYSNQQFKNFSGKPISAFLNSVKNRADARYLADIINPLPYFTNQKNKVKLYWKTDSHWTFHGSYCAYQLICFHLGVKSDEDLINRKYGEAEIYMDLGSTLIPPVNEKARFYQTIQLSERVYANPLVEYKESMGLDNSSALHRGSNVVYKNKHAKHKYIIIIFGDSFSEYRPTLLTGLMAETFSEVHFVWSTSLDYTYINQVKPDVVLTEIVERFMPRVPNDEFCLNDYVNKKLSEVM